MLLSKVYRKKSKNIDLVDTQEMIDGKLKLIAFDRTGGYEKFNLFRFIEVKFFSKPFPSGFFILEQFKNVMYLWY